MKTVFFCPSCEYVGAAEEAESHRCPKCGGNLYSTGMDREAYTVLTSEEKKAATSLWKYECSQPVGSGGPKKTGNGDNRIASMLRVIGIVIYVLTGLGTLVALAEGGTLILLLLLPVSGLILGTTFLGFGEIIRLLDVISKKN